ncbi:Rtf2 RING-finger [Seminavis robusta]|uniref:Rtf2 RING-finger n=1 Tax=Seminavis robusta TaxID=568900 RepID=A0A9N8E5Z6_9STRA|nr:Rtf2 RING-finger [Seminavis robusta]|eukprot:Sro578_g169820.1 Rtf2 RING-finger (281) ;mRNA; f:20464-21306
MGGDGGVIAVKRAYCRGAGTADHTGDYGRSRGVDKTVSDREEALQRMTTCALTKLPLPFDQSTSAIVACPYGRLYQKEAAVEALIRRKQEGHDADELGAHIRGLKDLYNVRFHLTDKTKLPSCPVTGQEFNGQLPAILLVPGNPEMPNVVSQRAFKEMGKATLETEYGPFQDEVRLAPPPAELEEIKEALEAKRAKKKDKKDKKKDKKKRKEGASSDNTSLVVAKEKKKIKRDNSTNGASDVVRGRVQDAIKSNDNLSSLFTNKDKKISQQEQAANLFAR